jgi:ParB-like chromosome segregation protein Spo0J
VTDTVPSGPAPVSGPADFSPEPVSLPLDLIAGAWPFSLTGETALLAESVRELGILRPLWAIKGSGQSYTVIAGSKRLKVLKDLGSKTVPVLVPKDPEPDLFRLWSLALADNLGRSYNPAEKALLWRAMSDDLSGRAKSLIKFLELPRADKVLDQYYKAAVLPPPALCSLACGRLDLESAALISDLGSDASPVWAYLEQHKPSLQNRKLWLEWLLDLKRARNSDFSFLFKSLDRTPGPDTPGQAAEMFRQKLWTLRFPKLAAYTARRHKLLDSLPLPPEVRLKADPSLEDLFLTLTLTLKSARDLEDLSPKLAELSRSPSFLNLWDLKWPGDGDF